MPAYLGIDTRRPRRWVPHSLYFRFGLFRPRQRIETFGVWRNVGLKKGPCLAIKAIWNLGEYQCWRVEGVRCVTGQSHRPNTCYRAPVTGLDSIERWLRHLRRWYSPSKALI
jgi:hypothetical protein